MKKVHGWIWVVALCVLILNGASSEAVVGQRSSTAPAMSQQQVQAVLSQYCIACHNQRQKAGSLELDSKDLAHLDLDTSAWESVIRKLRTGMMPPKSVSRPDRATLDNVATWLENGLDRAAEQNPNPGAPSLHRMNRNEYANAIRDLLDLQIDVTKLLPSDSTVSGFDNIADVLGTSPTLIQSYVSAAMKISRLAVGDLSAPPVPVTYNAPPPGQSARSHFDGLPLGTQGGMIVRHNFPLDAEYQIQASLSQRRIAPVA